MHTVHIYVFIFFDNQNNYIFLLGEWISMATSKPADEPYSIAPFYKCLRKKNATKNYKTNIQ